MTLITKSSSSQSRDGKTISVSDTTGAYNVSTNLTGYGASQTPAGLRQVSNIIGAELDFYFNGSSVVDYSFILNSGTAQGLANGTSTYDITMGDVGGTTGDIFDDQVITIVYKVLFNGDDVADIVINTANVTLSTLNDCLGAKYFILVDGSDEYTYEILSSSGTSVVLTEPVTQSTGTYNYKIIYESTNYLALTHNVLKCINIRISEVACSTCSCKEKASDKVNLALIQYFGISTNMNKGNYNCAQEIIESLTIYCGKDGCNC